MLDYIFQKWMPHGHCFLWTPDVLWTNVLGDVGTAIAYFLIPLFLFRAILKMGKIYPPIRTTFILFGCFIGLCGLSHVIDIITVWYPVYRIQGYERIVLAVVSLITVFYIAFHPKLRRIRLQQYTLPKLGKQKFVDVLLPPEKDESGS